MAIAFVTHAAAIGSGVNTSAVNTSTSNLFVAGVSWATSSPTVSDSQGNSWTFINTVYTGGASQISLYYSLNPTTSAAHTFKATGGDIGIFIEAFSGVITSSALDQTSTGTANSTTVQPGIVTPTVNNSLLVSAACNDTGGGTTLNSVSSGFTITDKQVGGSAQFASGLAYLIQTSAVAENPTFTFSSSNVSAAAIATFKPPIAQVYGFTMPFPA